MEHIVHSDIEMKQLGETLTQTLTGGDIMLLYGELGAGKTTLVKGIAHGLSIAHEITSPTFTLMNVYPIEGHASLQRLVHIDTYRLDSEQQLKDIGIEDYLGDASTLTIIEWPEKLTSLLRDKTVTTITLTHRDETSRHVAIDSRTTMP